MSDLDTQLRDYFEHVVERLDPTDVNRAGTASAAHELTEVRLIEDGPSVDDSKRRWPLVGVAAAALLAAVLIVVRDDANDETIFTDTEEPEPSNSAGQLEPDESIDDSGSTTVTSDPVSSATTPDAVPSPNPPDPESPPEVSESGPPPSVVDSLGYRWSRVPDDEVAFGHDAVFEPEFGGYPAVDGTGGDPWGASRRMASVTAGGPGLVAVGTSGVNGHGCDHDAAVWTSVDGITWSPVAHDGVALGVPSRDQGMSSVTAGGPGLVAVGGDAGCIDDQRAAVWTSVDGLVWSRVPHDEAVFGGEGSRGMASVAVGGPGLVAVGLEAPS
jgi:hypothetical protein